jgi:hypothetical protein
LVREQFRDTFLFSRSPARLDKLAIISRYFIKGLSTH